jgi:hypothetical protein
MQGEKTTCLPCLNTKVLLQTLALDLLQLVARMKLAQYLRAHKNTFNKQNNTPSMNSLKGKQGLGLRKANTRNTRNYREIWMITYKS